MYTYVGLQVSHRKPRIKGLHWKTIIFGLPLNVTKYFLLKVKTKLESKTDRPRDWNMWNNGSGVLQHSISIDWV